MHDSSKIGGEPKRNMWTALTWNTMNNMQIYRSNWRWSIWALQRSKSASVCSITC